MEKKPEKRKVFINKVSKRLLELWPPSVKAGLEDETRIIDFEEKIKIGQGSFGQVFYAKHKKTGAIYAIKAIDKKNKTNQEGKSYFRREIEIMYKIRHPNIVKLYTHFEDDDFCYFVMEYVSKGNLYDNLQKQRKKCFDIKTVALLMRDLLSSVYYLHKMDPPIVHRDIKLENILINEFGRLKLTDFGWSNYIFDDEVRDTFCGTPVYQAPEMINRKEHDHNVDIWCMGIIMFEMLTGYLPFNATNKEILEESIKKVKINWPNDIDRAAKDLISKILRYDPKDRISIENMFKHPFFTGYIQNTLDYLIKPNPEEEMDIFIISQNIPKLESNDKQEKEKSGSILLSSQNNQQQIKEIIGNVNKETTSDIQNLKEKNIENLSKIKLLQDQLLIEQSNNKSQRAKIEIMDQEKSYLLLQLNNLKKQKEENQENSKKDDEKNEKFEKADELELINKKLLEEIDSLTEKLEFYKEFYVTNINEMNNKINDNINKNSENIENTINNFRDSIQNMKSSSEVEKLKESFEREINILKELMSKEREKYNYVFQNNIDELNKLQLEKNEIKESCTRYYEKVIFKYDEKLKLKNTEIEELKLKIKAYEKK